MNATARLEQQLSAWDEATDGAFFRVVSALFPCEFVYAAGVLLAQNDPDSDDQ